MSEWFEQAQNDKLRRHWKNYRREAYAAQIKTDLLEQIEEVLEEVNRETYYRTSVETDYWWINILVQRPRPIHDVGNLHIRLLAWHDGIYLTYCAKIAGALRFTEPRKLIEIIDADIKDWIGNAAQPERHEYPLANPVTWLEGNADLGEDEKKFSILIFGILREYKWLLASAAGLFFLRILCYLIE